jgi:hypothetical protein
LESSGGLLSAAPIALKHNSPTQLQLASKMSTHNCFGQIQLMIDNIDESLSHYQGLVTGIGEVCNHLSMAKQKLLGDKAMLEKLQQSYNQARQQMDKEIAENSRLQDEVDNLQKIPALQRAMMVTESFQSTALRNISDHATPPASSKKREPFPWELSVEKGSEKGVESKAEEWAKEAAKAVVDIDEDVEEGIVRENEGLDNES